MTWIMVDVEADGPIPADYSMVSIGAVVVEPGLGRTFFAQLRPVSERWVPEALAIANLTREQTLAFGDPAKVTAEFAAWAESVSKGRPVFVSDNNGFDWQCAAPIDDGV